jgi:hypothetical protein
MSRNRADTRKASSEGSEVRPGPQSFPGFKPGGEDQGGEGDGRGIRRSDAEQTGLEELAEGGDARAIGVSLAIFGENLSTIVWQGPAIRWLD